ncbi:hypothetical protein A9P82_12975 [Arachidicoccus ginsenosidimutans]|uniref:hypothetical protein n=1 Tax=Arachidicoccus sp. BS20 TaxID=1850526 RepID=UPI0007F0568A|nr:hypothetical protein [Arachidicoccus sp. BS20]ANI90115.1 hypothetical protein A9P82_12975 [Arachidicoccus sp. BS20]
MAKAKKSAPAKLTPERLQELKDAIISGEQTKSIHERLGVSIANIGYHKGELKKKGLLGTAPSIVESKPSKGANKKVVTVKKKAKAAPAISPKETATPKSFKLIVNGVSVHIEGAGSVSVGEDYIKVDF